MSTPRREGVLAELRAELLATRPDLPEEVPQDVPFMEGLHLDSLDVIEFVARAESLYRVRVPDEDWQRLTTLEKVADYVLERLQPREPGESGV